jgi:hypothetical protein
MEAARSVETSAHMAYYTASQARRHPAVRTSGLNQSYLSSNSNFATYVVSYSLFDSPFRDKTSASAGLAVPVETGDRRVWAGSRSEVRKTLDIVFFWE